MRNIFRIVTADFGGGFIVEDAFETAAEALNWQQYLEYQKGYAAAIHIGKFF